MKVPMGPLHPKDLFVPQPMRTVHIPAMHQKDNGHNSSNLTLNEELGRSLWTRCLVNCANLGQLEKDAKC